MIGMAERRVLDLITAAGAYGATSGDLMAAGITRSEATARPSHLGDQGLIVMLSEKRARAHVWILPQFVGGRTIAVRFRNAPKRTAVTATSLDGRIYGFLSVQPATDYEVFKGLEAHYRRESGVSGNRSHLLREGMVGETGSTRMHGSARACKVWQAIPGYAGRFAGADLETGRSAAQAAAPRTVPTPTHHAPVTGYDPRLDGADCDHCPMRRWEGADWAPVPSQRAKTPGRLFLGEAPGGNEVRYGKPFMGESGKELNEALKDTGISRTAWDVDNVIACRAPKDKWELVGAKLRRDKKNGLSPDHEQHPADHCRPRLEKSLARAREIITLGGKAAGAVLGGAPSILSIRGGPVTLPSGVKLLPTVHPAFVRRARRWRRVFRADLRRARRFFAGNLQWIEPPILYRPTPTQLAAFFATSSRWWSYDVETDAKEPLLANLRCIAIAKDDPTSPSGDSVVVVPFHLIDSDMPAYPPSTQRVVAGILRKAMTDGRVWCGHNAGWYDRLVMEEQLAVRPHPLLDTILLSRLSSHGELPKGLGVVGSLHCDVTAWKQDNEGTKLAFGSQNDAQLHHYCAIDTAVTHRIATPLMEDARVRRHIEPCAARPEWSLLSMDHGIQGVCAGMTRVGLLIDAEAQRKMEAEFDEKVAAYRAKVLHLAGSSTYNPASVPQTRAILYGSARYDLEPVAWTDTGDPSTGDPALREHLMNPTIHPEAAEFLRALRQFRKAHKLLTGFIRPLKLRDAGGVLDDDGRLRVAWSSHVPITGRVSSSQPMNVQNWPKSMRKLVIPAEGHVLVGADFDQLEGRIGAARWGLKTYLDAYRQDQALRMRGEAGIDPHQLTMELCFGQRIWGMKGAPPPEYHYRKKWPGGAISGQFDACRALSKSYYYAKQYSASDETVWELLRKAENDDGTFLYADLKVTEVAAMSRKFLAALPELRAGWDAEVAFFEANGFNFEPLTGRRRDFLDGPDLNEIVNFPVQASGAAIMNIATLDVAAAKYVCHFAGPGTGIIQQGHDALVLEVPEGEGLHAQRTLEACMTQTYRSIYDVTFTAEAELGERWSEV